MTMMTEDNGSNDVKDNDADADDKKHDIYATGGHGP